MNSALQQFARQSIKEGLAKLPPDWQHTFRRMYGHHHDLDAEVVPINTVVDEIPPEKLDWAMQQVENSVKKLAAQGTCS